MSKQSKYLLQHVRVFDGERIRQATSVIIDGDRIGTDATDAIAIDCENGVLLPGFIDCHVHARRPEHPRQLCRWGVTTALDMGSWPQDLRESLRQQAMDDNLTQILSAGIPATVAGTSHSRIPGWPQDALCSSSDSAEQFVADRIKEGSDYIKIIADVPGPEPGLLDALVFSAHEHGKLTVAHATTTLAYTRALHAGVDVLTHAPVDQTLDGAAVGTMTTSGTAVIPTLRMMQGIARASREKGHNYSYDHANESVSLMHARGIPIFVGTDANTGPESPVKHGEGLHEEMNLLVEAGMTPVQVIRAATIEPAKYFGLHDRGVIAPGHRADLVLIANDPTENIGATRAITRVWCRGVQCDPTSRSTPGVSSLADG